MVKVSPIREKIGNGFNHFIKKPGMTKFLERGLKDPAGFAASMMVYSLISKDAVNCAIYTIQSYTNKEIPDEKRPFVMYNDLIQGFINVGGQFASFKIVEKLLSPKWFGKHYSGTMKDNLTKEIGPLDASKENSKLHPDNIKEIIKGVLGTPSENKKKNKLIVKIQNELKTQVGDLSKVDKATLEKEVYEILSKKLTEGGKTFKSVEKGFAILVSALATTALVKRTLNPLISTPIAGALSERGARKIREKEKEKKEKELMEALMFNATLYKTAQQSASKDKVAFSQFPSSRNNIFSERKK